MNGMPHIHALDMTLFELIFLILTVAVVGIAIIQLFVSMPHRRQKTLAIALFETWGSPTFQEARQELALLEKTSQDADGIKEAIQCYRKEADRKFFVLLLIPDFFELLGFLAIEKQLSLDDIETLFGDATLENFKSYKPWIDLECETYPECYKCFKDLVKKIDKLREKKAKKPASADGPGDLKQRNLYFPCEYQNS